MQQEQTRLQNVAQEEGKKTGVFNFITG
jgi:hypothetical protein